MQNLNGGASGDGLQASSSASTDSGLSYSEAFPALPENVAEGRAAQAGSPWGARGPSRMAVPQDNTMETLVIPFEERKYKTGAGFGKEGESERNHCSEIMKATRAQIVLTQSKDQSLTLLITGKREDVRHARNAALQYLQTQANDTVEIPKEYHRFLLGLRGKTKEELEVSTGTKINVPRMDDASTAIKITGTKEGIDIARGKIVQIYEEQSKRGFERLNIPKHLHPFICGPNNATVDRLRSSTGVQINVPPPSIVRDEISVSGEKEAVAYVKNELLKLYETAQTVKKLELEVPRGQHRYVQGPRSAHLHDIFAKTGVWVELPPADSDSATVTLRGDPSHFKDAVTMVYGKANSTAKQEIKAPNWIHKIMIGRGGGKVKELAQRFPDVHVAYTDEDKIVIEGPPQDVDVVKKHLEAEAKELVDTLAVHEMNVDEKFMKHIIGKGGANVSRIKNDLGVQIRSSDSNRPNVLVLEGPKSSVAEAVKILTDQIGKMERERSKDIIIDRRLHKLIIGQKGEAIRDIRDQFKETNVLFPDAKENSDVVTIRGPKEEVEKCYKHLEKLVKELNLNNFRLEVPIFKDMHRSIIGKGGATIRKIREETDTRIDLPAENSDSDVIVITGRKENAEKAKEMIQKIQNEIANAVDVKVNIPHKLHTYIIGAKGRTISGIIQECGNVHITIPQPGSMQDEIVIRGPKADAEKAKTLVEKVAQDKELSSYTIDIPAKQEYHRYITGINRANVSRLRERFNVRIVIPSAAQEEKDIITVIGRKEDVEKAKVEIEKTLKDLHNTVDDTVVIPLKYHKNFIARRAEIIREIQEETGVNITFPRAGEDNETVILRGPRDGVDAAKNALLQRVMDWESYVTIELDIAPRYYGNIMGPKGQRVMNISYDFDVHIKFPERRDNRNGDDHGDAPQIRPHNEQNAASENFNGEGNHQGEGDQPWNEQAAAAEAPKEVITITGRPEDCEAAKDALLSLVPVLEEVEVPFEYHRLLIGKGGANLRRLTEPFQVRINIPNPEQQSNIIKITGLRKNVDDAKAGLLEEVKQFDKAKEERALRSFKVEMRIDPKYHFKLIGQRGAEIIRLREEFDVDIQLPRQNDAPENLDRVVISGFEAKAIAARDKIQSFVDGWASQMVLDVPLDSRIHARIIGGKGSNLRRLMDRYKVDIRFPRRDDENPNLVTITGDEENVYEAEAELKRLEDNYLDDVGGNEGLRAYHAPGRNQDSNSARSNPDGPGFIVRGAPWEQSDPSGQAQAPQTGDLQEFPSLAGMGDGSAGASQNSNSRWGAPR